MNRKVLEPWIPIKMTKSDLNMNIEVWGRVYEFSQSMFPTRIVTAGKDILASPIALHSFFEGKEAEYTDYSCLVMEENDSEVKFVVTQTAENIVFNGHVTVEYDGFVKLDFSVIPFWEYAKIENNVPRLDKLYIDIPVKKEYAPLYHFWPNDDTGGIYPNHDVVNSGELPKGGADLIFKPYVWSGWEYGGIGVASETDKNIELKDKRKTIQFIEEDDRVIIRLNLLDDIPTDWQGRKDVWTETLKPIDYSIAFQATPIRPLPENATRDWHVYYHSGREISSYDIIERKDLVSGKTLMEEWIEGEITWVVLHERWSYIQNFGIAKDPDDLKKVIDECHKNGIKVMLYFGYEYSTLAPQWHDKADNYLLKTVKGNYCGGWQRPPYQRAFIACYQGGYAQGLQERVKFAMDEYGADGIYTDGTYIPWECANVAHGCGYTDKDGVLHTTYPVFALREHVRKLYEIAHERGGIIDTHQSSCCLAPTLAFCDSYFDGENIQDALARGMEFLSLDAFRAEYMGKNLGLPTHFLAATNIPGLTIRKISSITLLHDVHARPGGVEDLRYISAIRKVFREFDADHAVWHPYWDEANPVKTETEGAFCSSYSNGNCVLAVITNTCEDIKSVKLSFNGLISSAKNACTKEKIAVQNNEIEFAVSAYDPQLLILEMNQ